MLNFFVEISPLVAFLIGYKTRGIFVATLYMLILSVVSILVSYLISGQVNKVNVISTLILLVSGSLTIFSGNSVFIKLKPTILYSVFAFAFLFTNYYSKPAVKYVFGSIIKMSDEKKWAELNTRFMWFFVFMALLNEFVWRNFSENSWVNFKVFAVLPITLLFVALQIPFIVKHKIPDATDEEI